MLRSRASLATHALAGPRDMMRAPGAPTVADPPPVQHPMPEVVLFQPALGYWEYFVRDVPISLLAVARHVAPRHAVELVDGRIPGWRERLAAALASRPRCLGITVKTGRPITFALEASAIARSVAPEVPIVWGGVHPSLLPEQTLAHPHVDVVVEGEAEETFRDLVEVFGSAAPDLASVAGIWFRRDGEIVRTAARPVVSLNALTPLPYELVRFADYEGRSALGAARAGFFETGRGCPWTCHYCYNERFHDARWRPFKADKIVENLRHLRSFWDVSTLYFVDDSFFTDPKRPVTLAQALLDGDHRLTWRCEGCVHDLAKLGAADLALIRRAGCDWVAMGVETGSARLRASYDKRLDVAELFEVNRRLGAAGIHANFNIMTGFLGETRDDLRATTRLALELLDANPAATVQSFQAAVPYPGTRYAATVEEAGHALPGQLEEWQRTNPEDWMRTVPWLDAQGRNLLRSLFLASLFVDGKVRERAGTGPRSWPLRLLGALYRPIARFRIRHLIAAFPIEALLFDTLLNHRYVRATRPDAGAPSPAAATHLPVRATVLPPAGPQGGHLAGSSWMGDERAKAAELAS